MITEEEREKVTKILKALATNSEINYATSNCALTALLLNFTRETQLRLGADKAERSYKLSEKICEALPEDLTIGEILLMFSTALLTMMMNKFEIEMSMFQKFKTEDELKKTSPMYV